MQLRRLKRNMVHVIKRILAFMPMLPKKYYCTVCGSNVTYFLPYGVKTEVFAEKEIIGGGYRKNVRCPICGANDRMRFLDYILCKKTDIYSNPKNRILHFAPEKCIETKIRNVQNRGGRADSGYITGDINPNAAEKIVDVTNICFSDHIFDYVIINHVLEHILDEKRAMQEIKRVLKTNGKCIFSMPICENEDTYESETVITEEDRLKKYGQKDHVRLYGRDVKVHMEQYGYHIKEYKSDELLTENEIKNMRVIKGDRIFVAESMGN